MTMANGPPDIATADEVLVTLTHLLRSDKSADILKAAEHLAKYYDLYGGKNEGVIRPAVIAEVEAAVAALASAREKEAADGSAAKSSP